MPYITSEMRLAQQNAMTIKSANEITINDMQTFGEAQLFLTELLNRRRFTEEYWKPLKQSAKKAHSDLCQREKEMLDPIKATEAKLKAAMSKFAEAYEANKAKAEEEQRNRNAQEAERLRAEAETHESEGNAEAALICREMAETVFELPTLTVDADMKGVRHVWSAEITNLTLIPAYYNGMELRKVNMAALLALARMTDGTAKVDGVEFKKEIKVVAN